MESVVSYLPLNGLDINMLTPTSQPQVGINHLIRVSPEINDQDDTSTELTTESEQQNSQFSARTASSSVTGSISSHVELDHKTSSMETDHILAAKPGNHDLSVSGSPDDSSDSPLFDPTSGLSLCTFRPTSTEPSLSLLYADTAPRSAWRPQLEAWMKRNQPSRLREISRSASIPPVHQEINHNKTMSDNPPTLSKKNTTSHSWVLSNHPESNYTTAPSHSPKPTSTGSFDSSISQHRPNIQPMSPPTSPTEGPDNRSHATYYRSPDHHHSRSTIDITLSRSSQESQSALTNSTHPDSYVIASSDSLMDLPQGYVAVTHIFTPQTSSPKRRCISCGSDQSPCWRPSWSASAGQLCNSCGLRYKKTAARCISSKCGRIPAKGEWVTMKNSAVRDQYGNLRFTCLYCNGAVEVGERH